MGSCSASGGSYDCTASTVWNVPGTYYVVCNAYDTTDLACSGNPWCEYIPNPPSGTDCASLGFSDCYEDSANVDFVTVNVVAPTPTPIPTLTNTPTPIPTLTNTPTPIPTPTNTPTPTAGYIRGIVWNDEDQNQQYVIYGPGDWSSSTYFGFAELCEDCEVLDYPDLPFFCTDVCTNSWSRVECSWGEKTCEYNIFGDAQCQRTLTFRPCVAVGYESRIPRDDFSVSANGVACYRYPDSQDVPNPQYQCLVLNGTYTVTVVDESPTIIYGFTLPLCPDCSEASRTVTVNGNTVNAHFGMYLRNACDITANPLEFSGVNDLKTAFININIQQGGFVQSVFYTVNGPPYVAEIADPSDNPVNTAPFSIEMRSLAIDESGDRTYTAVATMDDGVTTCSDTAPIIVNVPPPWCQIGKGDAIVGHVDEGPLASITVPIPILDPITYLMTGTPLPGIPIAGGSVSASPGLISERGWRVQNSPYAGNLPSYTAFRNKIPDTVPQSVGGALGQADLTNLGNQFPAGSGYFYIEYDGSAGPLTIQEAGGINLGTRKVIVFADSAVNINDKINLTKGVGFFMLIASGNITINQSVGGSNDNVPEIEGVYYTDRNFYTGTEGLGLDNQLHIRGVVVAGNTTGHGVVLDRSTAYTEVPGEIFEFGADQSMLIPPALSKREIRWREVLP
jgi:hypothetical protein